MFIDYQSNLKQQFEQSVDYALKDIKGFPYEEYQRNLERYTIAERWFSGEALQEEIRVANSDKEVALYPVQINPIPGSVFKHSYVLFGETRDDERPLVFARAIANDPESETDKKLAQEVDDVLSKIWTDNSGRALQYTNGTRSQIYGGCVFSLTWDWRKAVQMRKGEINIKTTPIRIQATHPKYFIGIPDSTNPFLLKESWVVRPITHQEAAENGVTIPEDQVPWIIEHITPTKMEYTINGTDTYIVKDGKKVIPLSGKNPFGFVPVVYIPHLRVTGFYGINEFDGALGLIKELNLRIADFGDAVNVDAHSLVALRNVNGAPKVSNLIPGRKTLDLGSSLLAGQANQPDAIELGSSSASSSMTELAELLYDQIRRELNIPAVADGEDEGSQRSGMTLYIRMWPLIQHTSTERIYWTEGLNVLSRMMLLMLAIKGKQNEESSMGITFEHTEMLLKQVWAPQMPRDREVLVNEIIARSSANLGSVEHLLDMLGDVENIEEEVERIIEWMERKSELEAPAFGDSQKGVSGSPSTKPTKSDSNQKGEK